MLGIQSKSRIFIKGLRLNNKVLFLILGPNIADILEFSHVTQGHTKWPYRLDRVIFTGKQSIFHCIHTPAYRSTKANSKVIQPVSFKISWPEFKVIYGTLTPRQKADRMVFLKNLSFLKAVIRYSFSKR